MDEGALTREIVALASEYGRYGYRRITPVLRDRGWPGAQEISDLVPLAFFQGRFSCLRAGKVQGARA
jgi:hypothetical protein